MVRWVCSDWIRPSTIWIKKDSPHLSILSFLPNSQLCCQAAVVAGCLLRHTLFFIPLSPILAFSVCSGLLIVRRLHSHSSCSSPSSLFISLAFYQSSLMAWQLICSVCLSLHHSPNVWCQLRLSDQILGADDCFHLTFSSTAPEMLPLCFQVLVQERYRSVPAGLSAVFVCPLFVARDGGTDGLLHSSPQRVSATKFRIMQDGFYCRNHYHSIALPLCGLICANAIIYKMLCAVVVLVPRLSLPDVVFAIIILIRLCKCLIKNPLNSSLKFADQIKAIRLKGLSSSVFNSCRKYVLCLFKVHNG